MADEVQAREKWLDEKVQEQLKKAKYDPPVVLAAAIVQQRDDLDRIAQPIINTPKPKVEPPKVEPPKEEKKEEKPAETKEEAGPPPPPEAAAGEKDAAAPMEHD